MVQVDFLIDNPINFIQADKNVGLAIKASLNSQVLVACSRGHAWATWVELQGLSSSAELASMLAEVPT